jgi:hypothetical protein
MNAIFQGHWGSADKAPYSMLEVKSLADEIIASCEAD